MMERCIAPRRPPPKYSRQMHLEGIDEPGLPEQLARNLLEFADGEDIPENT